MPLPEDGASTEASIYDDGHTFSPYDPVAEPAESVQPSPSPLPSIAPGDGGTGEQTDAEDHKPPAPEFDERHTEDFIGLLYLGRLDKAFTKFGHKFVVRTLTTEQLAKIGLLCKPYEGLDVRFAVYQSACVAAAVQTVDGQPLPMALTNDPEGDLRFRTDYVMQNWMPPVREAIYTECAALEIVARNVLSELGEASG